MNDINDIDSIISAIDEINLRPKKKKNTINRESYIPKLNTNLSIPVDVNKLILEAEEYKNKSVFSPIKKNYSEKKLNNKVDEEVLILKDEVDKNSNIVNRSNIQLNNKIINLTSIEKKLRLRIIDLELDKSILSSNSKKNEGLNENKKYTDKTKEILRSIYKQVEKQKKLFLDLKSHSIKIEGGSKVYKENYERLIIENNDIKKRLTLAKEQIINYENNKTDLQSSFDKLNEVLSKTNIVGKISPNKPSTVEKIFKKEKKIEIPE